MLEVDMLMMFHIALASVVVPLSADFLLTPPRKPSLQPIIHELDLTLTYITLSSIGNAAAMVLDTDALTDPAAAGV